MNVRDYCTADKRDEKGGGKLGRIPDSSVVIPAKAGTFLDPRFREDDAGEPTNLGCTRKLRNVKLGRAGKGGASSSWVR